MRILEKTFTLAAAVALVCLSSVGAMAANKLIVKDSGGSSDMFVVTDTGRIGVGTNNPTTSIQMQNTPSTIPQFRGKYVGTTAAGGAGFYGMHNNAAGAVPASGDRLAYFWGGAQSSVGAYLIGGGITLKAAAAFSDTSAPSFLTLDTTTTGAVMSTERVRITSTGNVGIGTTTPQQKLEVNGGVRIATATAKPDCVTGLRGTLWVTLGSTDIIEICSNVGGTPNWHQFTLAP